MVSDLLKTYSLDALRLYLGSHHYREAWSYDEQDLQKFQELADRFSQAAALPVGGGLPGGSRLPGGSKAESGKDGTFNPAEYGKKFSESMENDLGTPAALHALAGLAHGILDAAKGQRDVKEAQEMLRKYGRIFGLTFGSGMPEERVVTGWNAKKR
jgi:cysteinyl-tRNA synthetase